MLIATPAPRREDHMPRPSTIARSLLLVTVLAIGACGNPAGPDALVPAGTWGGPEASAIVTATGAHLEFPCGAGEIAQPLMTTSNGEFAIDGTYIRQVGPAAIPQPARFSGRVNNQTMTLSVTLSGGSQPIGSFTLTLGIPPSFVRCL
jgi:hypothetical protein